MCALAQLQQQQQLAPRTGHALLSHCLHFTLPLRLRPCCCGWPG